MENEIPQKDALIFNYITGLLVLICTGILTHRLYYIILYYIILLDNTKDCQLSVMLH